MNRVHRPALLSLATGVLLVGTAYLLTWARSAPTFATWAMILGIAMQLGGITVLGGSRQGRPNRCIFIAAIFLMLVIIAGFGAATLLPAETAASGPYLLGLPRRAAIILLGVGMLPFFILPFLYAADFEAEGLDHASLEHLREECRQLREARNAEERR